MIFFSLSSQLPQPQQALLSQVMSDKHLYTDIFLFQQCCAFFCLLANAEYNRLALICEDRFETAFLELTCQIKGV